MLTIRFNRIGKKNKAHFRLVVQEHTIAPGGGHVEILGSYDPHLKKDSLKSKRIKYWIERGVKFSDTAFNFLVSKGLIQEAKRKVKLPKKEEAPATAEKPAETKIEEQKIAASELARDVSDSVAGGEEIKPEISEKKTKANPGVDKEKKEA
ncbi:30S ribosomal protein S16 [Patescibacteria group bacterium]|nr:30S ribosomal protein S16 [Patescibacteria group bacterium]